MLETPAPKPAATLVLVSSETLADPQVFMLKRQSQSGFWAGVHVFPGGVVEEEDLILAGELLPHFASHPLLDGCKNQRQSLSFFIAAIRETAEESGFLLAQDQNGQYPAASTTKALVDEIQAGKNFNALLKAHQLWPHIQALKPISWWITPTVEKRRYDTRFFLATLPAGQSAQISNQESSAGYLINAQQALRDYRDEKITLLPPTIATLEQLAQMTPMSGLPIQAICPELIQDTGKLILALPGDPLHSQSIPALPARTRFEIKTGGIFF
jgi:8-oxo-dGTP pyrophosphatase MutT (NUDIX family)